MSDPQTLESLLVRGRDALRRSDFPGARDAFAALSERAPGVAVHWFGLAVALKGVGAQVEAVQAIDTAIRIEPRNLRSHLFLADLLQELGREREAAASFQAVVRLAESASGALTHDLHQEVIRAQNESHRYAHQFEAFLRAALAPLMIGSGLRRFDEALDILAGRKTVYTQQPKYFHFPGLANRAFFDAEEFAWLPALEVRTDEIREELLGVMRGSNQFSPYLEQADMVAGESSPLVNNLDWSAYFLWKNGDPVAEHVAACPRTMAALSEAPLVKIPNRSPSVLFSQLRPKAHIPPHNGLVNTRLICHLPLIVPDGCWFRVGNDRRHWREGQAWVFDDSIEHEAYNESTSTRVILLFEIWRPELTEQERILTTALFAAIDAFGGPAQDWSI